jgi:hypothetical protein
MQAIEFIRLAGWLAATRPNDPALRTAVSRAYYGAFHLAKEFLDELGFPTLASAEGHASIVRDLQSCGSSDALTAGGLLRDLRTERNDADYRLMTAKFSRIENVRPIIETAIAVEQLVTSLRQEPARTAVQEGIRAYRRRLGQP